MPENSVDLLGIASFANFSIASLISLKSFLEYWVDLFR